MNPDQPSREEIEVKLTALLLGELPADETKLLRWAIAHDAKLKQLHDRLKLTIGLVREVSAKASAKAEDHETVKTDDLKLSESRRGKLLAQLQTPSPNPLFWLKRIEMPRLIPILAVVALMAVLAAMLLPSLASSKKKTQRLTNLSGVQSKGLEFRTWGGEQAEPSAAMAPSAPLNAEPIPPRIVTVPPAPMLAPPPTRIVLPPAEHAPKLAIITGSANNQGTTWNVSGSLRGHYNDGPAAHGGSIDYGLTAPPPQSQPESFPPTISSGLAMPPAEIAEAAPNTSVNSDAENTALDKSSRTGGGGAGGETALGVEFCQIVTNNMDLAFNRAGADRTPAKKQPGNIGYAFATGGLIGNKGDTDQAPVDSLATAGLREEPLFAPPTPRSATSEPPPVSDLNPNGGLPVADSTPRPDTSVLTLAPAPAKESVAIMPATPPIVSPAPTSSSPASSANEPAYQEAKRKLAQIQDLHKLVYAKIEQTSMDLGMPTTSYVQIVEPAEPGKSETLMQKMTGTVESQARIKIENEGANIASLSDAPSASAMTYDSDFLQTTFEIMKSDVVLGKVVDDLKLDQAWAKSNGSKLDKKTAIALLKKRIQLQPVTNTKMIEIKATSDQPEEAANIANALAKAYQGYREATRKQFITNSLASLNEEFLKEEQLIQQQQEKVDQLEKKLKTEATNATDQFEPDAATRRPPADAPVPQPEILTRDNAFSTFSLNVSDVSFKLAAASLEKGQLPDPASIRSEEFINAFDYRDPEAAAGEPIAFATERARYPFAQNRDLLRFSIKTAAAGRPAGRALNLVLLLDNSGSMERADRVQIIRAALAVLTTQLQPQDTVSVVTFARTARLWLDGASGADAGAALEKIGELTPQGGTNLEEAMRLAYETARRHYHAGGLNRVVMLTDGAANLGNVDAAALTEKVEANRRQGIALDCFGIGWEGLNDDLLEQLTRHGDGRYAFINTPEDATQQFAAKLAGALQIAAADVKVQVEFNPQRVVSYRQIGYAKHQLTKEQFRDNTVDAAEIAAQEAGNALYTVETKPNGNGPVATVRVRYKVPGTTDYRERSWDVPYTGNAVALAQASPALRLAATASAFSEWLAASPFAQEISPAELTPFMAGVPEIYGADERPKQLVLMLLQAKSLTGK